jgi:magnesium chelatase family protein
VLARTVTHALVGLDARRVEVEAHLQLGVPAFAIVGLADRACQEAKERVRSGIASAELEWPVRRITVNLAPAELRKEGSGFDLPIALAVLAASRQVPPEALGGHAAVGELALDGRLRPVGGVLASAEGARQAGLSRLLCAAECGAEAALAGIQPVPVHHLAEAVAYLRGEWQPPPPDELPRHPLNGSEPPVPDLADVRGQ